MQDTNSVFQRSNQTHEQPNNQTYRTSIKMPRWVSDSPVRDPSAGYSYFPGSSTVDYSRSSSRYGRDYSPSDSRGIDPTYFRKNAFAFDVQSGQQPKDYKSYDIHSRSGSSSRDRLAEDVSRLRMGSSYGGGSSYGPEYRSSSSRRPSFSTPDYERSSSRYGSSSGYGSSSRYGDDDRYSPRGSQSRSRYDDFLSSSSSGRRARSPPRSSSRSSSSSYKYFLSDDVGREYSRRPSYSSRSGSYSTYEIKPSSSRRGSESGYYESSGRGSSSRRERGRFDID